MRLLRVNIFWKICNRFVIPFQTSLPGLLSLVGKSNEKFSPLLKRYEARGRPAPYLAFFDCFNRQLYFEAHEVLEALWLKTPDGNHAFYKGLIQLAGAFVHVQKQRKGPALALLALARQNLERYPGSHEGLDVTSVLGLLSSWSRRIRECSPGKENQLLREAPALFISLTPIPAG